MTTVSLTTDWGDTGLYSGIFKAKLVKLLPGVQIVDISHNVPSFHIENAAFALRNAYKYFAAKSIHVLSVSTSNISDVSQNHEYICFQYNYQYFIGPNNGIWELVLDCIPETVYKIEANTKKSSVGNFQEADAIVETIGKLALGTGLDHIGELTTCNPGRKISKPAVQENQIIGAFLYFDSYGNGISNITKEQFDAIGKGRPFTIMYGRPDIKAETISTNYDDVNAPLIALFNVSGFLELALPFSSLKNYLFASTNTKILVHFYENEEEKNTLRLF